MFVRHDVPRGLLCLTGSLRTAAGPFDVRHNLCNRLSFLDQRLDTTLGEEEV